jgi:hypothetical protein
MRSIALAITLMFSASPILAQSGTSSTNSITTISSAASPLDGNWQIAGSREHKQYPAISMLIHVNGKQIYAAGDFLTVCSNGFGSFGGQFHLSGEVEPDASFTLRAPPLPFVERLTIVGKIPPAGTTSWTGTYELKNPAQTKCVFDQKDAFSGSPLPMLSGNFSGASDAHESDTISANGTSRIRAKDP